ncbi:Pickpocket protein 28 [Eumeta japonica]|uniref:Pickpocket protein 28 n=1 Tax=Eumeta variegata TaxID=151549 RepID=A0A4C1ZQP3_EUMVA|nr:Pickpocket protein 28 [Eumeta japonica]
MKRHFTFVKLVSLEVEPQADCGCLPACAELSYAKRTSRSPLRERLLNENLLGNRTAQYFKENMLVVHFFFEETSFVRYTKGEIFGLTEFLCQTGPNMDIEHLVTRNAYYVPRIENQQNLRNSKHPDVVSNTGGLLGLCMGFSVMSAVELLYFLTLRALCLARRRRRVRDNK